MGSRLFSFYFSACSFTVCHSQTCCVGVCCSKASISCISQCATCAANFQQNLCVHMNGCSHAHPQMGGTSRPGVRTKNLLDSQQVWLTACGISAMTVQDGKSKLEVSVQKPLEGFCNPALSGFGDTSVILEEGNRFREWSQGSWAARHSCPGLKVLNYPPHHHAPGRHGCDFGCLLLHRHIVNN